MNQIALFIGIGLNCALSVSSALVAGYILGVFLTLPISLVIPHTYTLAIMCYEPWFYFGLPICYFTYLLAKKAAPRRKSVEETESTVISYPRLLPVLFDAIANPAVVLIGILAVLFISCNFIYLFLVACIRLYAHNPAANLPFSDHYLVLLINLSMQYFLLLKLSTIVRLISPRYHLVVNNQGILKRPFIQRKKLGLLCPEWDIQLSWKNLKLSTWTIPYSKLIKSIAHLCGIDPPSQYLIFSQPQKLRPICLPLDWLPKQKKQELLEALQHWAPNLLAEEQIRQFIIGDQPQYTPEYTELWMQALENSKVRSELKLNDTLHDGQYQIVQQLGTGGQGTAFLAVANTIISSAPKQQVFTTTIKVPSTKQVVLKEFILPTDLTINHSRGFVSDFENELAILKSIDHPDMVKLTRRICRESLRILGT